MPFFNINLRNIFKRPRTLPTQQAAETARDMAMNVVNRVNDNPQPGNLAPVRYEHIVGHLGANINTRPQPVAEELHEEQPVNQPVAQPVAEELHEEQPVNQPAHQPGNRPVNQPINQGSSTNSQNQVSGEQRHYSARPSSYCPGITPQEIYPINEEGIRTPGYTERMVNDYLAEHNYSQQAYEALEEARMAQLRASQPVAEEDHNFSQQAYEASGEAQRARQRIRAALQRSQALEQWLSQPFIDSNIPAQPFVNSSNIPAFQPAAQQNNPNPIFTVRHTLGTPGYNLENAPATSRTFHAGTRIVTGYDPNYNQRIEMDTDLNNEDRFVFRNIPEVEISRGNQHYTFDDARVVRVKRSGSIDENNGQAHIDRHGNFRINGQRN